MFLERRWPIWLRQIGAVLSEGPWVCRLLKNQISSWGRRTCIQIVRVTAEGC